MKIRQNFAIHVQIKQTNISDPSAPTAGLPQRISYLFQAFTLTAFIIRKVVVVPEVVFNTGQSAQYNRSSGNEA